jgi:hypothetical protein
MEGPKANEVAALVQASSTVSPAVSPLEKTHWKLLNADTYDPHVGAICTMPMVDATV